MTSDALVMFAVGFMAARTWNVLKRLWLYQAEFKYPATLSGKLKSWIIPAFCFYEASLSSSTMEVERWLNRL